MPAGETGIARRLKSARQRRGLSREALAFHSGISWSAIAQAESGRRTNLRPSTLSALARALHVTIDYLVSGCPVATRMLEHRVLLYETDATFLDTATQFLAGAVEDGEAAIAVIDPVKTEELRSRLGVEADHIRFASRAEWYRSPVAALTAYREFVDSALDAGAPWARILGEPVWTGRSEADVRLWTRYESLFNLVFSCSPVTALCPYDTREVDAAIIEHAKATHPHAVEGGEVVPSPGYAEPDTFMIEG